MVNDWPKTDTSLIRRLDNPANDEAWRRFDSLYRPLVLHYARVKGLGEADADELSSDVMRRVARAATRWGRQRPPQHFSRWLRRVAHNALLNLVTRELSRRGTGGTSHLRQLHQRAVASDDERRCWQRQRQKTLLLRAATKMRDQFETATCEAFWQTHVENRPIAEVAQKLGKSPGAVYAIRSRMIRWLRDEVRRLEALDRDHA